MSQRTVGWLTDSESKNDRPNNKQTNKQHKPKHNNQANKQNKAQQQQNIQTKKQNNDNTSVADCLFVLMAGWLLAVCLCV